MVNIAANMVNVTVLVYKGYRRYMGYEIWQHC
jgi:hypothetical protein